MASFLVTGGCGFIGSHLVDLLVAEGHDVRVLDNLASGKKENLSAGTELIVGDITDRETVAESMRDIDGCFHLASVASVVWADGDWPGSHQVNLAGSVNIFNAARERKVPVVYASSSAVYGDNADTPLREHAAVRPLTAYGADKLGNELHARVASLIHGVPTVGLRLFNVYGPRQDPKASSSGVIATFVDQVLQGGPVTIHGDGDQVRDFVHVTDVARFLRRAMSKAVPQPTVFNVCSGRATSVRHLAHLVMSIAGKQVPVAHVGARCGDIRAYVGDPARSRDVLGVRVETSLADGLRRLVVQRKAADRWLPSAWGAIPRSGTRVQSTAQPGFYRATIRRDGVSS
ncbi:MAG: NAD-dependent epimerase/dehydratase family protein [Gammaproteobacteria bacterium]|nr:NAD-dependent epimerase/dehydratase family protein [Gammaproteobacteria bacterium]